MRSGARCRTRTMARFAAPSAKGSASAGATIDFCAGTPKGDEIGANFNYHDTLNSPPITFTGTAMSRLDEKLRDWHQRAARYRQLSALLGEDETGGRLHTLALEMEHRLHAFGRAAATAEERMLDNAILLAQIDTFLARARGAMFFASRALALAVIGEKIAVEYAASAVRPSPICAIDSNR